MLGILLVLGVADGVTNERLLRVCAARAIDVYYGEYWRVVTGAFMHGNLMHLAMNCFGLYLLGRPGEVSFGTRPLMQVYFVALLGGNGLALALQDPATPLVGASGAVFGIFGMWLGFFLSRTGGLRETWNTAIGRQLLVLLAINAAITLAVPQISLWGHLGGFVPGLALGYYHERRAARRAGMAEHASVAVLVAVVIGLCVYAAIPFNRAGYVTVQALKAYERGDLAGGDTLLNKARALPNAQEGALSMMDHLRAWRLIGRLEADSDTHRRALRWPLMGIEHGFTRPDGSVVPFRFLQMTPRLLEQERLFTEETAG